MNDMTDFPSCDIDLWADDVLANPYDAYRALRDLGPVVWLPQRRLFALPRFAEVRSALMNWQTFSSASGVGADDTANSQTPSSIIKSDPPVHDRHRQVMAGQLSLASLADDAVEIADSARRFTDAIMARGSFDAVADLARPYSLAVVGDLIGLPAEGRERLPHLAEQAFNIFGPANERLATAPQALGEMFAYAHRTAASGELCPGRRAATLVEMGEPDRIVTYTWPGIDTTVNAVASAVYLFATHPEQWQLVRNDPSLIPSAFAEVLRVHTPVHYFTRLTTTTVDVSDTTLPAGSRVLVMYGSANRDERHYPDPDRFDVTRNPIDQLAFGRGIHLCVGIHLARIEAHTLLGELARRVERFELVGEPEWLINNTLHGPSRLPVIAHPAQHAAPSPAK
jgi:cytochrome P450